MLLPVTPSRTTNSQRLQKHGRTNDATPATWKESYTDFTAPLVVDGEPAVASTSTAAVLVDVEMTTPANSAPEAAESEKKKRKRTDDEKAERKKKKEEKKAKKEKKVKEEDSGDE